ncbi:MAG TPA: hypothetical protein VEK12_10965 [Alphaproteobacteria bacterium]|nr:hypothetical protein [Alphaproteobacteria bacterium]
MTRRRRLLSYWLLFCSLALGTIAALNASIDVAGVIRGHSREAMAQFISDLARAPYGVAYVPRERAIKLALLQRFPAECYAIGSSHINGIAPNTLPEFLGSCASFLNLWVGEGALDDMLVFARHIGESPGARTVVIGLDWWFIQADTADQWLDQSVEVGLARAFFAESHAEPEAASALSLVPQRMARTLRYLVNGDYLIANLENVAAHGWHWTFDQEAVPVSSEYDSEPVYHADGNMSYTTGQLAIAERSFTCNNGRYDERIAARREPLFVKAASWLRSRNIAVVLVITPVNEVLTRCPSVIWNSRFEARVREIGARLGVPVVGGLDPRPFGITAAEIAIEGLHPLPGAFAKLRALEPTLDANGASAALRARTP